METNGDNRPLPQSGLYRQKETGIEIVLTQMPGLGSSQIDAFIQAGYERVGDIPTETKVEPKLETSKK